MFGKVLSKLVYYKVITPDTVERSEPQYSKLVTTDVKENKPEYVNYSGTHQRLDEFMMKFVGESTKFSELWNLFKILLIILHGQAQAECRFSVNKNVLVELQYNNSNYLVYHPQ